MLTIPAKTVYIDPEVLTRPNCKQRLDRVLPNVRCRDIRDLTPAAFEEINNIGSRRHGKDSFGDDAVVVFTTWNKDRESWFFHWRDEAARHGGMCQPAVELNIVSGCIFRCMYCGFGRVLVFYLEVEHLIAGLDDCFEKHPLQRLYKYSNMTDLPPFEPELDAIRPLVERFAREQDRYLMLFTKSNNLGFLEELDHRGHTIISWSLTCDSTSRLIDRRTANMHERIDAMVRMQKAGYPVRARLSPIVPIADWREEHLELFESLFKKVRPDLVTIEMLGWMTIDDVLAIFDESHLDSEAMKQAKAAQEELKDVKWGPFTQATHDDVYAFCIDMVQQISPQTPISVCHGTAATWKALGNTMRMRPENYICNCGGQSAPGGELYDRWPLESGTK
jgi:DNA repair photolyase